MNNHLNNYLKGHLNNTDFWGEVIDVYTDADARNDGTIFAVADLKVYFNGQIINRATGGAVRMAGLKDKTDPLAAANLRRIADDCRKDGQGFDMWGIFENEGFFGGAKFWLVPNEVDGYTIMLPSEY